MLPLQLPLGTVVPDAERWYLIDVDSIETPVPFVPVFPPTEYVTAVLPSEYVVVVLVHTYCVVVGEIGVGLHVPVGGVVPDVERWYA